MSARPKETASSVLDRYDVAVSIVTFHNPGDEISQLLASIRKSSLTVHLTVVDNSATDALRSVVSSAGAHYVFPGSNMGFGKGHNLALRKTLNLAPYQAIVNPDILVEKDTLERLYTFMQANPQIGQVMPGILNPDGTEQRLTKRLPRPDDLFLRRLLGRWGRKLAPSRWEKYELRDQDLTRVSNVPCLSGCFMFLRSDVLEEVGLFDERYFMYMEDVDLCRRIGSVSDTVFFPEANIVHGYAKGSYKSSWLTLMHARSAIQYFNKWGWLFDTERAHRNKTLRRSKPLSD